MDGDITKIDQNAKANIVTVPVVVKIKTPRGKRGKDGNDVRCLAKIAALQVLLTSTQASLNSIKAAIDAIIAGGGGFVSIGSAAATISASTAPAVLVAATPGAGQVLVTVSLVNLASIVAGSVEIVFYFTAPSGATSYTPGTLILTVLPGSQMVALPFATVPGSTIRWAANFVGVTGSPSVAMSITASQLL